MHHEIDKYSHSRDQWRVVPTRCNWLLNIDGVLERLDDHDLIVAVIVDVVVVVKKDHYD